MTPMSTKKTGPKQKLTDMKQATLPREDYDWSDPRCPQCGIDNFIVRCSEVRPVRKFTKRTLAEAVAAGGFNHPPPGYPPKRIPGKYANSFTRTLQVVAADRFE